VVCSGCPFGVHLLRSEKGHSTQLNSNSILTQYKSSSNRIHRLWAAFLWYHVSDRKGERMA